MLKAGNLTALELDPCAKRQTADGGFASTTMMQGIRDGMEDHELCLQLERLITLGSQRGLDVADETAALSIPAALVSGISTSEVPQERLFTEDPAALRAQWLAVVKAITSLSTRLSQLGADGEEYLDGV